MPKPDLLTDFSTHKNVINRLSVPKHWFLGLWSSQRPLISVRVKFSSVKLRIFACHIGWWYLPDWMCYQIGKTLFLYQSNDMAIWDKPSVRILGWNFQSARQNKWERLCCMREGSFETFDPCRNAVLRSTGAARSRSPPKYSGS